MPTGQAPIHTNQLFSPLESFLRFEKQKNSYFFKLLTSTVRTFNILCTDDKMYMTLTCMEIILVNNIRS